MARLHAALVNVLGLGVLLRGESAVGKSECALELVQRGHRLVADDVVQLEAVGSEEGKSMLRGRSPEMIRHYIEIRGIGLLHIADLYGRDSVQDESSVGLICGLEPWDEDADYERIGIERPRETIMGVSLPCLRLPVHPARSMATLVEVAVRDELQREAGVNAAKRLDEKLTAAVSPGSPGEREASSK
ncbi:MAG: hypothetical protein VX252_07695 [Myxococcota bacterium]|nr:hypothetical protein [Myxococcota bacterium]